MDHNVIEPVVVALQDAAFGKRSWELALRMLAQTVGVRCTGIVAVSTRTRRVQYIRVAPESPEIEAAVHLWLAGRRSEELAPSSHEWFTIAAGPTPAGVAGRFRVWMRCVYRDDDLEGFWALLLPAAEGPSRDDPGGALERLAVHLGSSIRVCRYLQQSCAERLAGRAMLAQWPEAIVLVDETCTVLYMNRAAQSFLAQESSVYENGGRLACRHPHDDRALADAVRQLVRRGSASGAAGPSAAVHQKLRGAPPDVAVYLFALPPAVPLAGPSDAHGIAGVVLHRHRTKPRMEPLMLERAFGLTPAETRVGMLLAEGESVHAIAQQQGVSVTTVRSHLKSLFQKTGIHRQAELVRVLVSLGEIELPQPQARVAA